MTQKTKYPVKLIGKISWVYDSGNPILDADVKRALLRSKDEIALHCEDKGYEYNVSLSRIGKSRFEGQFTGYQGRKATPASANCSLYSNEDGYLLFGNWKEAGYECRWWAELTPVKHFTDEGSKT